MVKDLTEGKPLKLIVQFFVPVLLGILLQQFYGLVDTAIVGKTLGMMALGGVGSTSSLSYCIVGFCTGACSGLALPVAQAFGAGEEQQVRRYAANSCWICAGISALMMAAVLPNCRGILKLMQTPEEQFRYAYIYVFTCFCGIPAAMLYNMTAAILRALGDSKTPVVFLAISAVLNIGLDLLFICVCSMGVFGAALATVLAQLISGMLCLIHMGRKYPILRMQREDWRLRRVELGTLLINGLPMGLQTTITGIGAIILTSAINELGPISVSAISVSNKINGLMLSPYDALAISACTFTGQNLGAGKIDRIRQGLFATLLIGTVYWVFYFVVVHSGTRYMLMLFLRPEEQAALEASSVQYCKIIANSALAMMTVTVFRLVIQGMGYARIALFSGIAELLGRYIGVVCLIPLFGYVGACWTIPLAWLIASAFVVPTAFVCLRRCRRRVETST